MSLFLPLFLPFLLVHGTPHAAGQLTSAIVNPASTVVRVVTNYVVSIMTLNPIPINGGVVVNFPVEFQGLPQSGITCEVKLNSPTIDAGCVVNGLEVSASNVFASGVPSGKGFTFTVKGVTNPDFAITTQSFAVYTTSTTGVTDELTTGLTVTLVPGELKSAIITPGTSKAGEWSIWTVSIQMNYSLAGDGRIYVQFPDWNAGLIPAGYPNREPYATQATCQGASISPDCQFIDISSTKVLKVGVTASISGSVTFTISSIRNPPLTGDTAGFGVQTGGAAGLVEMKTGVIVSISSPATFSFTVNFSPSLVSSRSTYAFSLPTPLPVFSSCQLILSIPSSISLQSLDPSLSGTFGIVDTSTIVVSGTFVTISKGFSVYRTVQSVEFSLGNVINAGSTRPSGDITVKFVTAAGVVYMASDSPASVVASPNILQNVSVTPEVTMINAVTAYTFSFTTTITLPSDGGILLTLPGEIAFQPASTGEVCANSKSIGLHPSFTCLFDLATPRNIRIINGFSTGGDGRSVKLVVNNVQNAPTAKQSGNIRVETYDSSEFLYVVERLEGGTVTTTPDRLKSVEITPQSLVTGAVTPYTLSISTKNPIPKGGSMTVTFPAEVTFTDQNVPCGNLAGFEATVKCRIVGQVVSITGGLALKDYQAGVFSLSIPLVRNPVSTKPTASFAASSLSLDGMLIDQLLSGGTVTMTTPNLFPQSSIHSSSITVGAISALTFTLTPKNPIYPNSIFEVTPPTTVVFPASPVCTSPGPTLLTVACSVSAGKLSLSVTISGLSTTNEVIFIVNGVKGPGSTKPTGSFVVVSTISTYMIDRVDTGLVLTMRSPGVLNATVAPTETGVLAVTKYDFQVEIKDGVETGGYLIVSFPSEITVSSSTQAVDSRGTPLSSTSSPPAIKVFLFPSSSSPAILSFSLSDLKNGSSATTQSQLQLQTYTSDGFLVDSGSSNLIQFGCYSPCATCSTSPTACLSCLSTSSAPYFYAGDCHRACQAGAIAVGLGVCQPCNPACDTCSGSVDSCVSCVPNGAKPYLYQNQCLATCPLNTFPSVGLVCASCSSECQSCIGSGSSQCTSCISGKVLSKGTCVSACPSSTLLISKECVDCAPECLTCGPTVNVCTSCGGGTVMYRDTCVGGCPAQVTVKVGNECKGCNAECATCVDTIDVCGSCGTDKVLMSGKCVGKCPPGQFNAIGQCRPCASECSECMETADKCSSCGSSLFLYQNRCVVTCPDGLAIPAGTVCVSCVATCKTCVDSPSKCSSCPAGLYLQSNSCVAACPAGSFPQLSACQPCARGCSTCTSSASNCFSCEFGYYLYGSQCVETCPARSTVYNGQTCVQCQRPCLTCEKAAKYCTTCVSGMVVLGGDCVETCPTGYDIIDGVCQVNELPPGQCAKGCTPEKLQNSVCDPVCDYQACGFDNSRCNTVQPPSTNQTKPLPNLFPPAVRDSQPIPVYVIPRYSEELRVWEVPFPGTAVSAGGMAVALTSKFLFTGTSLSSSLHCLSGALSPAAGVALAVFLSYSETTLGPRKLLNVSVPGLTALFTAISAVLTVHFLLNLLFVYVYLKRVRHMQVVPRDFLHKNWRIGHPTSAGVVLALSVLFSFKMMRLMTAKLFEKAYFSANFLKKEHFYQPLLCQIYISLAFVSFPLIAISLYTLITFSTGNIAFLLALDCAIVTLEDILTTFWAILELKREMQQEKAKFELPKFSTETQETAVLDLEQIQVQMVGESGEGRQGSRKDSDQKKYFDSERDVYEMTEATSQAADLPQSFHVSPLESCTSQDFVNVSFSPQDPSILATSLSYIDSQPEFTQNHRGISEEIPSKVSEESVEDI